MYCKFEVLKIYFHQALCMLDPTCLTSLSCTSECKGDSFVAGLCAYECGEAGLRVHTYTAMLTCWGIHHCQESRPNPAGVCAASSLDEVNFNYTYLSLSRQQYLYDIGQQEDYLTCSASWKLVGCQVKGLPNLCLMEAPFFEKVEDDCGRASNRTINLCKQTYHDY